MAADYFVTDRGFCRVDRPLIFEQQRNGACLYAVQEDAGLIESYRVVDGDVSNE